MTVKRFGHFVMTVISFAVALAIYYFLVSHTFRDGVSGNLFLACAGFAIFYWILSMALLTSKLEVGLTRHFLGSVVIITLFSIIMAVAAVCSIAVYVAAFTWITEPAGIDYMKRSPELVATAVTLIGLCAFGCRNWFRATYGCLECLSGIATAYYKAIHINDSKAIDKELLLAIMTAGGFLIVRGMVNIKDGIGGGKTADPVAAWVIDRLR